MRTSETRAQQTNRTITIAIAAIVLVFAIFTIGLWRAHFFTFTGSDNSEKIVAEALAFVGGLIGAVVSVLGVLLKYSIDSQAEHRAAIESERSAVLQKDSENRLKLEAATKAVQLFGTSDGKETPPIQRAGALVTLASLDQHSLAIALTDDLLRRKKLEPGTAALVINQALLRGDLETQIDAVSLLVNYPAQMLTNTGFQCPMSIVNWHESLSPYVREFAPIALATMMTERPLLEWHRGLESSAYVAIAAVALAWLDEKDPRLTNDTGAILSCLLRAFPETLTLCHPKQAIDTEVLRPRVRDLVATTSSAVDAVKRLNSWIEASKQPPQIVPAATTPSSPASQNLPSHPAPH
jgi:hypothetical protein